MLQQLLVGFPACHILQAGYQWPPMTVVQRTTPCVYRVGKTRLCQQFVKRAPPRTTSPTVAADLFITEAVVSGRPVVIQVQTHQEKMSATCISSLG